MTDIITGSTALILYIAVRDQEIACLAAEVERLRTELEAIRDKEYINPRAVARAALALNAPRAAWADAIQKNVALCEQIERLRAALEDIARQKRPTELYKWDRAISDFEYGYDELIVQARAALEDRT